MSGLYNLNFTTSTYTQNGSSYSLATLPGWSFANSTGGYSLDGTTSFAANTPRVTSAGLLIEPAATNLINSGNTPTGTSGQSDPSGGTGGVLLNQNSFNQWQNGTTPGSVNLTLSFFAKATGTATPMQFVQVPFNTGDVSSNAYANFDLVNGTVPQSSGIVAAGITSVGGNWYRCYVTALMIPASANMNTYFWPIASGTTAWAGSGPVGAQTCVVWGFQLEVSPANNLPTSLIQPNTTQTAARAADVVSLTYSPNDTTATLVYTSGTANPSPNSPINLGSSSGGAWVYSNIQTFVTSGGAGANTSNFFFFM